MVAVFLTCGLAAEADALPVAAAGHAVAGQAVAGQAVAPIVQPAAHKPNDWYWSGHWWRPGPWSEHVIHGMVPRRGHGAIFIPWGAERQRYCAAKYRSFDPATGTYLTRRGEPRVCR